MIPLMLVWLWGRYYDEYDEYDEEKIRRTLITNFLFDLIGS